MALRKPKADEARSLPSPRAPAEKPQGTSVEECVALGQSLVQSGHLDGERLAATLSETNGDLAEFGQLLLTRHGVGRAEYARALATACGIPLGDTRTTEINPELAQRIDERLARNFFLVPIGEKDGKLVVFSADPAKARRDAAEAAAGQKFEWFATDPKTVQSFIEQIWRSDADIGRLVAAFQATDSQVERADEANEVNLDDQAPVVQLVNAHREPGAARPAPATSTSSRSTRTSGSGTASTVSSSRPSSSR